ncbi:MAG: phage antirepressor N-terminal domain-containing protein [Bacteroidales bacterium]|nr:phage antirepressor N-terminal domain-containing protein [Bacteroidales bacterium]
MKESQITKVNNVAIVSLTENGNTLIPIRPICDALGINYQSQYTKIKDDEDLASTVVLSATVGADGKEREMASLPLEFIFGWLFTINPKNVKPEAQDAVRQYRLQCYKALFEYFTEPQTFLSQKQKQMENHVTAYQEKQANFRNAKREMDEAKKKLNTVMSVTIEEWRANNRQLPIPFEDIRDVEEAEQSEES